MTNGRMRALCDAEMVGVEAGGFWEGFACGSGIASSVFATFSPEPISKLAIWSLYSATIAACGVAFF